VIGTHLLVDFYGVTPERLNDVELLRSCLQDATTCCRLKALRPPVLHPFEGGGITGFILLAESHIALHTYPEYGFMALDISSCGGAQPQAAMEVFCAALHPRHTRVTTVVRGDEAEAHP
jgi:S-adenosylmethionine decarboxylase